MLALSNNIQTRTRADQHKCLLFLACISPTSLLFEKNKKKGSSKNYFEIGKSFTSVCRECRDGSITIYITIYTVINSIFTPLYQFEYFSDLGQ